MTAPIDLLRELSLELDAAGLELLRRDVRAHYEELERLRDRNVIGAVDLAEELCTRLEALLDGHAGLDASGRAAVVGAARYFVSAHDAVPDELEGGLEDDVVVFNHVARAIGRADMAIVRAVGVRADAGGSAIGAGD